MLCVHPASAVFSGVDYKEESDAGKVADFLLPRCSGMEGGVQGSDDGDWEWSDPGKIILFIIVCSNLLP